jgi:16S rRNA (uracil1498-N3)-methyltransferase
MNPDLRMSAAHVFVDNLSDPELDDETSHHLSDVLRLRDGESVSVCDGRGSWRLCRYVAKGRLRVDSAIEVAVSRSRRVGVAMVPVKGDRTEWAAEKLVEVGVDDIVLLAATRRSVVRWDDEKWRHQHDRYSRIVLAAARQSRCLWLPTLRSNVDASTVALQSGAAVADIGTATLDASVVNMVIIGPEGGFDADELTGAPRVGLADGVLRAETAAIVAATRMVAHLPR